MVTKLIVVVTPNDVIEIVDITWPISAWIGSEPVAFRPFLESGLVDPGPFSQTWFNFNPVMDK